MTRKEGRTALGLLLLLMAIGACAHHRPVRVLIIDGQNNHDWRRTTRSLRGTLLAAGRFSVAVSTTPDRGATPPAWQGWQPAFDRYDVAVSNYNVEPWP